MAVSLKLAGVFSLSLSPMLVAVFVWRAEERLELLGAGIEEMNFLQESVAAFLGLEVI